jgi:hypothetical protein
MPDLIYLNYEQPFTIFCTFRLYLYIRSITMNDIWRSERLVYRAFEAPTDDGFWHSSLVEPDVFVNGIDFLPRLWSAEELIGMRKRLVENALIFVIICKIQGSNAVSAEDDDKTTGSNTQSKKPKPVPIGMVNLSGPSSPHVAHHRIIDRL